MLGFTTFFKFRKGPLLGKLETSGLYDIARGTFSLADRLTQ